MSDLKQKIINLLDEFSANESKRAEITRLDLQDLNKQNDELRLKLLEAKQENEALKLKLGKILDVLAK